MLWKTLEPSYPDANTFIPTIAGILITWIDAFTSYLEADSNEENVDKLLEALKSKGRLELVLEVAEDKQSRPRPVTKWRPGKNHFVIALPQAEPVGLSTVLAGFAGDLLNLFTESPKIKSHEQAVAAAEDADWADLDLGASASVSQPSLPVHSSQRGLAREVEAGEDRMPSIATIPRPEELLKKPPYWMIVRQEGRTKVTVTSSHGPSLACLDEYLRRWCRGEVNRVDRPPMIEIKLGESAFGLGLWNDVITMEAIRGREVSAMLALSFVESVLGYEPMMERGEAGCVWEFRRMKGFR